MSIEVIILPLAVLLWLALPSFAQKDSTKKETLIEAEYGKPVILSQLGLTRIVLRNGNIKKDCKIVELHDYWIVYEKDGSLHDQMIDKIKRIELCGEVNSAIFFDEKNKPVIRQMRY